jgi:predicted RNA methylase
MDAMAAAVTAARYNEAVVVQVQQQQQQQQQAVPDEHVHDQDKAGAGVTDIDTSASATTTTTREIVLVATLDSVHGGVTWQAAATTARPHNSNNKQPPTTPPNVPHDDVGIRRHVRTKQWLLPMLNDRVRNALYQEAIAQACVTAVSRLPAKDQHAHRKGQSTAEASVISTAEVPTNAAVTATATAASQDDDDTLHILDIGAGTGLLAMMAATSARQALRKQQVALETHDATETRETTTANDATAHASSQATNSENTAHNVPETPVHVRSLEMASAMARLARQTVAANGFDTNDTATTTTTTRESIHIDIVEAHSCEFEFPASSETRATLFRLCTSELLEAGLLGEGILPALRDAWDRYLHAEAVVVPQRARVYAQLLGGNEFLAAYEGPSSSTTTMEMDFGTNGPGLRLATSATTSTVEGTSLSGNRPGVLVPMHAECLWKADGPCHTQTLSDPVMVMDFDFTSAAAMPGPEGRARSHSIVPTAAGRAQAVLFWWQLDLGEGLTYSTEWGKQAWQDHWPQCLYIFTDHSKLVTVAPDEPVCLTCHHTDTRLSFSLQASNHSEDGPPKRFKMEATPEPALTALRSTILADTSRIKILQESITSTLSKVGSDAMVLDLSDFSLAAVLAAQAGATRVVSLESSSCGPTLALLAARMAQLGNQLPREGAIFEILQCHGEELTIEALGGGQQHHASPAARLVVAEPYYEILEGWHLQEAINYYFLLQSFQQRGLLSTDHLSVPSYARIMGFAIQSDTIYNAYRRCCGASDSTTADNDNQTKDASAICGFDHGIVNHFAARCHEYDLSLPMWQYEYTALTDAFEIAKLDYNQLVIEGNGEWREVPFAIQPSGTCHALLLWIDYSYPSCSTKQGRSEAVISTKACPYNQVIRLMETPISGVNQQAVFRCRLAIGGDRMVDNEIHSIELDIVKSKHERFS